MGVQDLSKAIIQVPFLEYLELNFGRGENMVTDVGIKYLSDAIIRLQFLKSIIFDFKCGKSKVGDEGVNNI